MEISCVLKLCSKDPMKSSNYAPINYLKSTQNHVPSWSAWTNNWQSFSTLLVKMQPTDKPKINFNIAARRYQGFSIMFSTSSFDFKRNTSSHHWSMLHTRAFWIARNFCLSLTDALVQWMAAMFQHVYLNTWQVPTKIKKEHYLRTFLVS